MEKPWLTYLSLSDRYERKARFLPAVIALLFFSPLIIYLKLPFKSWILLLLSGVGISGVIAVCLSHMSSALGNKFQEKLWPKWPYDAPTNLWLNPKDRTRSKQQKAIWYGAIKRLTGLDIERSEICGGESEVEAIVNDAIMQLRNLLWSFDKADRLRIHNEDFGFSRNLAGLRIFYVPFSLISTLGCWFIYFSEEGSMILPLFSSFLSVLSIFLGYFVLPEYVKRKADHYAEAFLGSLMELDRTRKSF